MRQHSTGLAQPAIGRTSREPERAPPVAAPAGEQVAALHGVMTGLANLVNEHLGRLTIGPQATRFLRHLERQTFGNAGLHRRAGRSDPGLWCPYEHAEWAAALGLSASSLTHLRTRLLEAGIIWYTPGPDRRGQGAVGWSFDFASWRPPHWGGARAGAGRPRPSSFAGQRATGGDARRTEAPALPPGAEAKSLGTNTHRGWVGALSPSSDARPTTVTSSKPAIQAVNGSGGSGAEPWEEFKMSTSTIQDVNLTQSRRQRLQIKMSTPPPEESSPPQVPVAPVRRGSPKNEKKERRRTDAYASGVARTPRMAPAAPDLPFPSVPQATSPESSELLPRAQPPPLPAQRARAAPTDDSLPPPLPYETLRSYWLRIYREACAATGSEARPLVHAAARGLLNMGHERADYVLLGQLHQATGSWATVLHWILDCAARELADPRTYLRAIAARQRVAPPHRRQPSRQRGRPRAGPANPSWVNPADDSPVTAGVDWLGIPSAPLGSAVRDAGRSQGATGRACSPAGSALVTQQDQPHRAPVPHSREHGRDDPAEHYSAADAVSLEELEARARSVPEGAAEGAVGMAYVPMGPLWHIARQRLRADLTPAQFSSWLANTDLYRAPDGALVLVTRNTFAAELIARRWGERIQWILGDISGHACTFVVKTRRPSGAVPDG
jgi:hypothetical protein